MKCTKCNVDKPVSEFEIRSDTGTCRKQCRTCRKAERKKYYEENKEACAEYAKARYIEKREEISKRQARYYQDNKKSYRERDKKWQSKNRDKVLGWQRERNKRPYYKQRELLRSMIRRLGSADKNLLGYTIEEFRENIQSKFSEGMTWDNHGEWELDHIKPVIAFYEEGIDDPKVVNALDNLQPLWKFENRRKSSSHKGSVVRQTKVKKSS